MTLFGPGTLGARHHIPVDVRGGAGFGDRDNRSRHRCVLKKRHRSPAHLCRGHSDSVALDFIWRAGGVLEWDMMDCDNCPGRVVPKGDTGLAGAVRMAGSNFEIRHIQPCDGQERRDCPRHWAPGAPLRRSSGSLILHRPWRSRRCRHVADGRAALTRARLEHQAARWVQLDEPNLRNLSSTRRRGRMAEA
jgi:hypothetical protein